MEMCNASKKISLIVNITNKAIIKTKEMSQEGNNKVKRKNRNRDFR